MKEQEKANAKAANAKDGKVWARATVNLPRLTVGTRALVDTADPYIAECLEAGYLVHDSAPLEQEGDVR